MADFRATALGSGPVRPLHLLPPEAHPSGFLATAHFGLRNDHFGLRNDRFGLHNAHFGVSNDRFGLRNDYFGGRNGWLKKDDT